MSNAGAHVPGASGKPLHIVYAVEAGGGAETYARQIGRALSAQGQRVTVLYLCPPGYRGTGPSSDATVRLEYVTLSNGHYYYDRLRRLVPGVAWTPGSALVKVAEGSLALRRALGRIERLSGGIDLVEFPEETAFPALFRGLAPYAVKLHSSDAAWRHFCDEGARPDERRRARLEADLLRHAALVSAPSAAVADYVASACGYPRGRIQVLPYPLDTARFVPDPSPGIGGMDRDRTGHGTADKKSLSVLYVGRLDARKGLTILARAAEAILTPFPTATIDIVGGETEEVGATSLLRHVPPALHGRVVFHGRVAHADLPGYYRQAAVCVVPSRWDNSPNTVYEAMSCGRPVVASRVGGIPELVADGDTGLLVPRDDPAALASAVTLLLADPDRRAHLGRAARARAAARFAPDRIARQTLRLYRAALGHEGGARNLDTDTDTDIDIGANTVAITWEEPALARS